MKKVLFYTQNRWAFGSIHHGLCKELYKHGIYANLLDWTIPYLQHEFDFLNRTYDVFVTTPEAVIPLHHRGIALDKIVSIAHGQWDILLARRDYGVDFYSRLKGYGVISDVLKNKSIEFGVSRIPDIVKLGIHADVYKQNISAGLSVVGYAGMKETINFFGEEIKRGKLVEQAVEGINVELRSFPEMNHLCMPSYYGIVDCVVMSSTEEAGGLPMMEAAAAGRLTIGTPVGYYADDAIQSGGVLVSIDPNNFINETKEAILRYKQYNQLYQSTCAKIQEYAIENFNWPDRIESWINLLSK
jgi:glycosyltransferase involved in cell wall biosynthesis